MLRNGLCIIMQIGGDRERCSNREAGKCPSLFMGYPHSEVLPLRMSGRLLTVGAVTLAASLTAHIASTAINNNDFIAGAPEIEEIEK